MLSGPNAFDILSCLVAALISSKVNGETLMLSGSDICRLGSNVLSGSLASLPSRFLKWDVQFSIRFLADPPFIWMAEFEFFPESSLIVFQARWCFLLVCCSDRSLILPQLLGKLRQASF